MSEEDNEENEDENDYFNYNFNNIREYFYEEILNYTINTYREEVERTEEDLLIADSVNELINNIRNNMFQNDLERALRESFDESEDCLKRTDDDIVEFNYVKYENLENEKKKDLKCMICLEEFEPSSDVTLTECTHIFHHDCLKEWIRYKKECAVCRIEIKIK
jgi:hypothetical protein